MVCASSRTQEVALRIAGRISAKDFFRPAAALLLAALFVSPLAGELPDIFVHDFTGVNPEGITPIAPVVLDSTGYLYGTTQGGGTFTGGTVFKVKTDGTGFSTLHQFPSTATEGYGPAAGVTLDGAGNLYGTTQNAGTATIMGTVFTVRTDGTGFTTLHPFVGGATDGATPTSGLILDGLGYLYGTTQSGGANGFGTVFRMRTDGTGFTLLYSFGGVPNDGGAPLAGLVLDPSGVLYGTTPTGGTSGEGTIFSLNTDGTGYLTLYNFTGGDDGSQPAAPLVLGLNHTLFGTAELGGANSSGTVFKIQTDGSGFVTIYALGVTFEDASTPEAPVTLDAAGNLLGTASGGGLFGLGAVFKMRLDGSGYSVLHSFAGAPQDGSLPLAAVTLDSDCNAYGTTNAGGAFGSGLGTVFEILGAAPPSIPTLGPWGVLVLIVALGSAVILVLRRQRRQVNQD
jgi:uncharacterized repeat protein (TIGR03803 family)